MQLKHNMMSLVEKIRRIPRTRGFGVQSPTAYSILRHIINEKGFLRTHPLSHSHPVSYPYHDTKLERLIYRIRYDYPDMSITPIDDFSSAERYESLMAAQSVHSVLILTGIHDGAKEKATWNQILADRRTVMTFDLLDCGIVFFDNTKIKQNFRVNY